jgi:hypothetical protein
MHDCFSFLRASAHRSICILLNRASSGNTFLGSALNCKVASVVDEPAECMTIDVKNLAPDPLYASICDKTSPARPDLATFLPEFNSALI